MVSGALKKRPDDEGSGTLFFEMEEEGPRGCVVTGTSFAEPTHDLHSLRERPKHGR